MNADMTQIMGEFIGTMILILLGDGVCAKSEFKQK